MRLGTERGSASICVFLITFFLFSFSFFFFNTRTFFIKTLRLRLNKIEEHTKNIIQAESQLKTFLFRPNVFEINSINTDKIIHVKIQSILSN